MRGRDGSWMEREKEGDDKVVEVQEVVKRSVRNRTKVSGEQRRKRASAQLKPFWQMMV